MMPYVRFWRDRRGVSATEFAFAAPILLIFIFGMLQLGMIFEASNGLSYGLDEAARLAAVYPKPADTAITARLSQRKFGLNSANLHVSAPQHGTNSSGVGYVDITASYDVPINFVLWTSPAVTLTGTRRVYQAS